ncbi:reverse transcriptase domain-containing protein [Tanacetum coccineum]
MNHIKKQLVRCQQGWVDDLARVLWIHRTLLRNSQNETPFSLTYGSEAIIPSAESLAPRGKGYATKENAKRKEGKEREVASIKEAYYQNKLRMYHNIRSNCSTFKLGDFVLLSLSSTDGQQVWQGPHMLSGVYEGDLYKITDAFDYSLEEETVVLQMKQQQEETLAWKQEQNMEWLSEKKAREFVSLMENGEVAVARSFPSFVAPSYMKVGSLSPSSSRRALSSQQPIQKQHISYKRL